MKRIIWILTIVGLCLALVVSACAVPQVPEETEEFLAYVDMLEQAWVPEACEEAGIDFEETFVVPYEGEVPDGYTLLSLLFDSFGETDLWFAATALELYKEGVFTPDDLKALAVEQWKLTDEDEVTLEIMITENWKKEKIYHHSANIMISDHWKKEKVYPFYPSSLAAFLLATGNVHGGYSSILIEPETATNNVGEAHTVVAEVWLWTADGVPICCVTGQMVDFLVTGSHSESASITTDSEGEAAFSYQGTKTGDDEITATAVVGGMQMTATATKIWVEPPLTVTSPNGGETWEVGSFHRITWTYSGISDDVYVEVKISRHGISGPWETISPAPIPYHAILTCKIPGPATTEARIKVVSVDGTIFDISDDNFTILWVAPAPPPTPTLISPVNGSVDILLTPTLEWSPSSGATSYHLQVATETAFIGPVLDLVIPMTSYSISTELSYDTSYYWRVEACNEYGCSSWSEVWSFQTGSPALPF